MNFKENIGLLRKSYPFMTSARTDLEIAEMLVTAYAVLPFWLATHHRISNDDVENASRVIINLHPFVKREPSADTDQQLQSICVAAVSLMEMLRVRFVSDEVRAGLARSFEQSKEE